MIIFQHKTRIKMNANLVNLANSIYADVTQNYAAEVRNFDTSLTFVRIEMHIIDCHLINIELELIGDVIYIHMQNFAGDQKKEEIYISSYSTCLRSTLLDINLFIEGSLKKRNTGSGHAPVTEKEYPAYVW
ncbi:hypothetical protein BNJ_00223 [Kaumoebavirus]|uniref:hypothetical protein n=1 Tax=Kaumoebavirus TaxID=1859492 RepID=UPI0009C3019E|nr:hypothetical protein BNJ_00223 [Kaumoebavirus]ARA72052.1 hypothetical protein BNJ_00223 [Kaumoebavirus]